MKWVGDFNDLEMMVGLPGIEPVSVVCRERPFTVEEIRLAGWSSEIVPQIVP
jgi:hypothetical protein